VRVQREALGSGELVGRGIGGSEGFGREEGDGGMWVQWSACGQTCRPATASRARRRREARGRPGLVGGRIIYKDDVLYVHLPPKRGPPAIFCKRWP